MIQKLFLRNNLAKVNPGLSMEWHPAKNGGLTPQQVLPNSHKKIWWICSRGHEWNAMIASRSRGSKCPFCSGRLPTQLSCLETRNPLLSREWHPTKNGALTPRNVTSGSRAKVWWMCGYGHEWQSNINNRNRGSMCPYCSGKIATRENSLRFILPTLSSEWHPDKNKPLTPSDVTVSSGKKVWWKCAYGHEWKAIIANRFGGSGCPYCSKKMANRENCLETVKPALATEWHPTKNGSLSPREVKPDSHLRVWWKCGQGHEWQAMVKRRVRGSQCPQCSLYSRRFLDAKDSLQRVDPVLSKEWHPGKNGALTPDKVRPGSRKRVWWRCSQNHSWEETVAKRSNGRGCPYCRALQMARELRIFTEIKYLFRNVLHRVKEHNVRCQILIPHLKVNIEIDTLNDPSLAGYRKAKKILELFESKGIVTLRVLKKHSHRITVFDITYTGNSITFETVKKIAMRIRDLRALSAQRAQLVSEYLRDETFKNSGEYIQLLKSTRSILSGNSLYDLLAQIEKGEART